LKNSGNINRFMVHFFVVMENANQYKLVIVLVYCV